MLWTTRLSIHKYALRYHAVTDLFFCHVDGTRTVIACERRAFDRVIDRIEHPPHPERRAARGRVNLWFFS